MTDALAADERRSRRRAAQAVFDELAEAHLGRPGVDRATMFGSAGLRVGTKFFAFVGSAGQLIVKVPAARAEALVAAGLGTPVRVGRAAAREWVGVPGQDRWPGLLDEARTYVSALVAGSAS
ncbi:hypothetical protein [Pseudonocardia sp. GCM10023141]|uniref:hypothetical protein n=1 Tax=Pseudonocardia sp. GCM10023141 TaxID=3252653 RepID=UPI00360E265A